MNRGTASRIAAVASRPHNSCNAPDLEGLSTTIEFAQQATLERNWPEARRLWDNILLSSQMSGFDADVYLGAGKASSESGYYDDAERILATAAERFPANAQIAIARAWLANARKNWPVAIERWKLFRAQYPDNPWGYLGSIHALRSAGRASEIDSLLRPMEEAIIAARQRGLDQTGAFALEMEIAKARLDWTGVRRSAESIISYKQASGEAPSAQVFLALAQACWHLGDRDAANHAASCALSANPALSDAVVVQAWIATERGDADAALSCYRRLTELNPETVRWPLKVIQLLNRSGRVREALHDLDSVRNRFPDDPMVKVFLQNYGPAAAVAKADGTEGSFPANDPASVEEDELRIVSRKAPSAAERRRPLITPYGERDVLAGQVANARTTVLIFTGSNDAVSMPLPIFDQYMATLDASSIYLKDFNRLRFLMGIRSLSDDYPGTLAVLRQMLHDLGAERLCTLGNCDGGFAAIRYGVELGAKQIITFGAPTHSPVETLTQIEQARNFMRNRLTAKVGVEMMDLKPFLEGRAHTSHIELFYEEEDDRDRLHSLHLAEMPGVTLHPQPGLSNHYLLRRLALLQPNFRGMLEELLGLAPPIGTRA